MNRFLFALAVVGAFAAKTVQAQTAAPSTAPAAAGPTVPADVNAALQNRVMGKADAPVTIEEYASLNCTHCAEFDRDQLPKIKADFIDTGKAKLVIHDYPLNDLAVRASMIARCVAPEHYFAMMDELFRTQPSWAFVRDLPTGVANLKQQAKLAGMSDQTAQACLDNKALEDGILRARLDADNKLGIQGTPTFIFTGAKGATERFNQGESYEKFKAVIERLSQ